MIDLITLIGVAFLVWKAVKDQLPKWPGSGAAAA